MILFVDAIDEFDSTDVIRENTDSEPGLFLDLIRRLVLVGLIIDMNIGGILGLSHEERHHIAHGALSRLRCRILPLQ